MNLVLAYQELIRKKFFMVSTIIQLLVSGLLLYIIITQYDYVDINLKRINNLFKNDCYVFEQNEPINLESINLENLINVNEYIQNNNMNFYSANETAIYIGYDSFIEGGIIPNDIKEANGMRFIRSKAYYANDKLITDGGLELELGKWNNEDEQYTPILLGYNYINKFKVNDKIKYLYTDDSGQAYNKEMIVTGFLKKGSFLSERAKPESVKIVDDYIILPFNINQELLDNNNFNMINKINIFNLISYGYYSAQDSEEIKRLENLENKFSENGLDLSSISLKNKFQKLRESTNRDMAPLNLFLISITILTVLSILVVIMNMINRNIYEYFVHILLGATVLDIIKRIIYEVLIIFIISISLIAINIKLLFDRDLILKFNIERFGLMSLILILLLILILIIPISKLRKSCLSEGLRSND